MKRFRPLLAIVAFCCGQLAVLTADKPNILLILTDDLGYPFTGTHCKTSPAHDTFIAKP